MLNISTNNCDRETINYIPARDLWINKLYMSLSNKSKYSCLTIDCRKSGPAKYRTDADSNFEQFCYYGQSKKDRLFNKFLAKKVNQNENLLVFQIDSVINVTKNGETKIYKAVQELKNLVKQNDGNERSSDRSKTSEQSKFADRECFGEGKKWKKTSISSLIITLVNQKKRKYETKKIKPYNTTRIKATNFLTNISYNGVKEEYLFDRTLFSTFMS